MEMTLDETIKHAEEVAEEKEKDARFYTFSRPDNYRKESSEKCAAEHRQLAEWLKDYKRLLEQEFVLDKLKIEIADIYCGQYCEDSLTPYAVREKALEIIDKYRAECEE